MVLLDMVRKLKGVQIVVAHFDHGIRADSYLDREFVQLQAKQYKLPFVFDEGRLGVAASEAMARKARYKFLRTTQRAAGARALITAHHQDDLIETALINVLRGTRYKGLTSLESGPRLLRPMLHISRRQIVRYAHEHNITWREDPTNSQATYLRNWLRIKILPRLSKKERDDFIELLNMSKQTKAELSREIGSLLQSISKNKGLDRSSFTTLPHSVALEVMASWLRLHNIRTFDRKLIEKLVIGVKTLSAGKQLSINKQYAMKIEKQHVVIKKQSPGFRASGSV